MSQGFSGGVITPLSTDRREAFPLIARVEQGLAALVFAWTVVHTIRVMRAGWGYTQDDAYVTLRYARNLAEGHGLAWNIGESMRVEGYSNFLFVLIGALALIVGADPVLFLKLLGCAIVLPTSALLYVLARRWMSPLMAIVPALLLTMHTGLAFWAVSMLETTVFQFFVVLAVTAFILGLDAPLEADASERWFIRLRTRRGLHTVAAVASLLASVTRPEGPVVVFVLAATAAVETCIVWRRDGRAIALHSLGVSFRAFALFFLLPVTVYHVWRIAYFGRLLPNTVYCKSYYNDKGNDPWFLAEDFWKGAKVYVAFAFLGLFQRPRRLGAGALPLLLVSLAYVAILHHADPIVAQFSRHFLAALALLVVLSAMGLANLASWLALPARLAWKSATSAGRVAGVLVAARVLVVLSLAVLLARGQRWVDDDTPRQCARRVDDAYKDDPLLLTPSYDLAYQASCYESRQAGRAALGRYLEATYPPVESVVLGDVGEAGYRSHTSIIDALCLNSPQLTRPPIAFDRGRYIDWVLGEKPAAIVVQSWSGGRRLAPIDDEGGFYTAIVKDPRFQEFYQPVADPPSFHAPIRGEGFSYVVCARKKAPVIAGDGRPTSHPEGTTP